MKNRMNKILAVALAVTLLALAVVAGTLAYLTTESDPVINVFTSGEGVAITLVENSDNGEENTSGGYDYEVIPGETGDKEIYVTVTGNECYVFVSLEMEKEFWTYASYEVSDLWVPVEEHLEVVTDAEGETVYEEDGVTPVKVPTKVVYAYVGSTYDDQVPTMFTMDNSVNYETKGAGYGLLVGDEVVYSPDITDLSALDEITLTVTAYAIQADGLNATTPTAIWGLTEWDGIAPA